MATEFWRESKFSSDSGLPWDWSGDLGGESGLAWSESVTSALFSSDAIVVVEGSLSSSLAKASLLLESRESGLFVSLFSWLSTLDSRFLSPDFSSLPVDSFSSFASKRWEIKIACYSEQ